jgi:hypothetical protein
VLTRNDRPDKGRRLLSAPVHTALAVSYLGLQLDGRYRLDRLLGEGASAWVFGAQDLRLHREVAVKVLKPWTGAERPGQQKRFIAEGRILAQLVHPHVVAIHDAGESPDGFGYLVMELSRAGTLEGELWRRGTLRADEAVRLLLPLTGALACAHDRGVLHRDVKPANIALRNEGEEMSAMLFDFGIAKHPDGAFSTDSAVGTPSYMAPEQARGDRLLPAADVWALGVVFFRCLSGEMPFSAATSLDTMLKLVHERAPRFADACPGLAPHLAVALDRALEPSLSRRYASMRDFARAIVIACAQDGMALPLRPDPIGLPELERWREGADVESTHAVAVRTPAVFRGVTSWPRGGRWPRILLAAASVVAAFSVGMLVAWRSDRVAIQEIAARRPAAIVAQRPRTMDAVPMRIAPFVNGAALAVNAPPSPTQTTGVRSQATTARPARRSKHQPGEPAQAAAAKADTETSAATVGPPPTRRRLVTTWDW